MGETTATLTALLFIVNPLLWLESSKAYSDTCGLFFLVAAAALGYTALAQHRERTGRPISRSRLPLRPLYWGSLIFGIMLGARLAYIPFVFAWGLLVYVLCRWRADRLPVTTALNGMVVGIGLWLVPFLLKVSLSDIVSGSKDEYRGHGLSLWRHPGDLASTISGVPSSSTSGMCGQRIGLLVAGNLMATAHPNRPLPHGTDRVLAVVSRPSYQRGVFVAWLVPYGLWLYIAQNPNNLRHVLPLLPPLLMVIAAGLRHSRYGLGQRTQAILARLCHQHAPDRLPRSHHPTARARIPHHFSHSGAIGAVRHRAF